MQNNATWNISNDNVSRNILSINVPELVEDLPHHIIIDGTMIDCTGNISIANQRLTFVTN